MSSNCPHGSLTSTKDSVPHPFYEALRATGPVHWDEEMKGWLAISHDICKYVLSHEELFRHPYADADATMIEVKGGPRNITVLQGEEHDRMHRYLMKLFNPEAIRAYTDRHIVPVTAMLLGRLEGQGRAELFSAFCKPLPGRTFMSLFGMDPPSDDFMSHVLELHDTIMHWAGGRHYLGPDATDAALAASHELNGILLPYIRKSRDNPGTTCWGGCGARRRRCLGLSTRPTCWPSAGSCTWPAATPRCSPWPTPSICCSPIALSTSGSATTWTASYWTTSSRR